jgi:hypothetical protein
MHHPEVEVGQQGRRREEGMLLVPEEHRRAEGPPPKQEVEEVQLRRSYPRRTQRT